MLPGEPLSGSYEAARAAIDAANAEDPAGRMLRYGERMAEWAERLRPGASEALLLAARAQHIRRWTIPRSNYTADRRGYLSWRTTLAKYHAEEAGKILRFAGYDEETIERAGRLIRKENLKTDPETQALEDSACLVFLEENLADFAGKHDEEKILGIIRKTWKKMSDAARAEALRLPLSPAARALVEKALSS